MMKCTDEKNIFLAVKGYKIFFSSTTLNLHSKPIAGLKTNRKPVVGLTTKKCQLFSGRGIISTKSFAGQQPAVQNKLCFHCQSKNIFYETFICTLPTFNF